MRNFRSLLIIFLCACALSLFAEENLGKLYIMNLLRLSGHPEVVASDGGPYTRIELTDSTTLEIYEADSILVVMTSCAPQCSSCARIYNKEWHLLQTVEPPFSSVFPLATIENGRIIWKNNDDWEY